MKYFFAFLFLSSPLWACHSLKKNPDSVGLKNATLCKAVNHQVYDVSFGKGLTFDARDLEITLKAVNTEFSSLNLRDFEVRGDVRDLHGQGQLMQTTFTEVDLRYADFRKFRFEFVKFIKSRLQGVNFKGVDLRQVEFIDCDLEGAFFDIRTKLPFSVDEALEKGMLIK